MSSLNTLTGRLGRFVVADQLVARATQWEVSRKLATSNEWGDSDSGGYTSRSAGRRDCTFTSEGKFDTTDEVWDLFEPEDIAEVALWMSASLYWYFPRALNSEFGLTVNIDSEEVIGWTSSWGADGIFFEPGGSGTGFVAQTLPSS